MATISNSDSLHGVFQDFIAGHPNIKFTFLSDAAWADITKCFIKTSSSPSIVARPKDASHVQELVRFCVSYSIDFVVRSGGHDCTGRSQVNGALTIDMRDIKSVNISEDKTTAEIGGGIITRELTKALDAEGLITPTKIRAPNASVGYVGWSTLGGYSPLSNKYGLGVDQVIGAKYVNAEGALIEAGEEELKAMRGGGGCLGIITEMTIKVYSLNEILEGTFVFESTNKHAAWASFISEYNKLTASEDIPNCLSTQLTGVAIPHAGNIFTVSCLWADEDHDEGRKWMTKIIGLGNCVREVTKVASWPAYCEEKEKLAGYGVFGRARTLNFKDLTPKTVEILAKYNESIPGPGSLLSIQFHRDPGHRLDSVFSPRCDHYWLEIIATSLEEAGAEAADQWALNLQRELMEHDPENILDSAYLGFVDDGEVDLKRNFGAGFESLMAVKQRVDPGNVFKNTIPRL
ncbi:6-hydroxy-D-nicotine oxidase [Fusarium pseudocircinatum]|uniref:6-hydroxy-D-nicotine oxidase n=1 Tax=Fusarium pseudocircinatum TaxID=56676 RepID=A0A8H5PKC3_9HYPO|nr:6-hydroxy-D-nicotine oxidase [Fusarium pseudocircinatum]